MFNLQKTLQDWQHYRAFKKTESDLMKWFIKQTTPNDDALIDDCDFLVLDIETTGLSIKDDILLSIGYVLIKAREIQLKSAQHLLVQSDASVGQSATIHGIHDQDLQNQGKTLDDAMEKLLKDLSGKVLVVHYAKLDYAMLNKICHELYNTPLLCPMIDTLEVERHRHKKHYPTHHSPALQLDACRERYNLPRYRAHNALTDAIATAELWLAQSAHIQEKTQHPLRFFY